MQTEPEQWAEALWEKCALADLYYTPAGKPDPMEMPAGIIQRAFEDRERKLREALKTLEASLTRDMGAGYAGVALCQALKETPDAQ